jgi:hypothetical protein
MTICLPHQKVSAPVHKHTICKQAVCMRIPCCYEISTIARLPGILTSTHNATYFLPGNQNNFITSGEKVRAFMNFTKFTVTLDAHCAIIAA